MPFFQKTSNLTLKIVANRSSIQGYINHKLRTAPLEEDKRVWYLFKMWSRGLLPEALVLAVQRFLDDAEHELETETDKQWRAYNERDKRVAQMLLS